MKKAIYYLLMIQLMLSACLKNEESFDSFMADWESLQIYQNVCPSVTDAVEYPEPWIPEIWNTFEISGETINAMSTCGLLETWLNHPAYNNSWSPYCTHCSDMSRPAFLSFNMGVSRNEVSSEFFKRRDCVPVLAFKYLTFIKAKSKPSGRQRCFEFLLASDMSMSVSNEMEKIQFMAMALEKMKYEKKEVNGACHIMVAIMLSCNYAPFVEEIGPKIEDSNFGYTFRNLEAGIYYSGFQDYHAKIIIEYAKQFLNEKNK